VGGQRYKTRTDQTVSVSFQILNYRYSVPNRKVSNHRFRFLAKDTLNHDALQPDALLRPVTHPSVRHLIK
jgi:hypothetical protein